MNIPHNAGGSENTAPAVGRIMNLYLVEAGATHRFALGRDKAQAIVDGWENEGYAVTVYYITTLTDCTRDFT
jgi:hypothetical protein